MDTDAYSPFTAQCFTWRGPGGQWTLTVVCKATFSLQPGLSPVLRESEPIVAVDQLEDGSVAVRVPSELAPIKPKADVLVVGSAFAPPGLSVTSLVARVAVEEVDKSIRVLAPRTVMQNGSIREGSPWTEMAFGYDRAAGGEGTWNPAGIAHDALDRHGRRSLPSLEPLSYELDLGAPIPPIGLGPIAADWSPRRLRLGAGYESAIEPGWRERPFPGGFDASYFQSAPEDQQLEAIPRNVAITLEHLHRELPRLETRLEDVRPAAVMEIRGRPDRSIPLRADTLLIDTDRAICTLVWRGQIAVASRDEDGLVTVSDERDLESLNDAGRGSALPSVSSIPVEEQHTATELETITHGNVLLSQADPLPFRPPPSSRMPSSSRLPITLLGASGPSALGHSPEPAVQWPAPPAPPSSFRGTIGQRAVPTVLAEDAQRKVLDRAAYAGVVQASHAAAEATPREPTAPLSHVPTVTEAAPPIELLWFEPAVAGRARAQAELKGLVREVEPGPLDDEAKVQDAKARADRATLKAILARAEIVADIEGAVFASANDDGALEPRLAVVAGTVEWTFDDVELLTIWTSTAVALAPGDKRVKEVADAATETMATPLGGEPDVARGFVVRLRDAWSKAQKTLPNDYIDVHARRLLLKQRKYDKRTFQDAEWIRGTLTPEGSSATIPLYIPSSAARALPLFVKAQGRVLGDLVPQRDETEKSSVAVLVGALARLITRRAQ